MPPLSLMIKPVSSLCNMRCAYCFYEDVASHRENKSYGMMTKETLETIMRRAFSYADDSLTIVFQGGEPTLAGTDFFRDVVRLERKYNSRGIKVDNSVQTNGLSLSEDMIRLFKENDFLVGVSLDGTSLLHDKYRKDAQGEGTYDRVMQTIKALRRSNVEFNILTVITEQAAQEPEAVFKALQPYTFMQFIPCLDPFDGVSSEYSLTAKSFGNFLCKTFDLYYDAYQKGDPVSIRNFDNYIAIIMGQQPESCAYGGVCGGYYVLESDGGVYPCDFYVLDKWRLGNIRETSFMRLKNSPVLAEFRVSSLRRDAKCATCPWLRLCRGGCRRERENTVFPNRFCEAYKALFSYALPRMDKIAEELE